MYRRVTLILLGIVLGISAHLEARPYEPVKGKIMTTWGEKNTPAHN